MGMGQVPFLGRMKDDPESGGVGVGGEDIRFQATQTRHVPSDFSVEASWLGEGKGRQEEPRDLPSSGGKQGKSGGRGRRSRFKEIN